MRAISSAAMRDSMTRADSRSRRTRAPKRGDEISLRAEDHSVIENFQRIGGERGAGRRDIDDRLGRAGCRRTFGRAEALDDAIIGDAVGEKAPASN